MEITADIYHLLQIGYRIATEKNYHDLFRSVTESCMSFMHTDGAMLYLKDRDTGQMLHFFDIEIDRQNEGKFIEKQASMEEVDESSGSVIMSVFREARLLRIADIYEENPEIDRYDFLPIKKRDIKYQRKTESVMVGPISVTADDIMGVMLLYNRRDAIGRVMPFDRNDEYLFVSLTTQMANTMMSMLQITDTEEYLKTFVDSLTVAIDAKTPYNGKHTRKVTRYCYEVSNYIKSLYTRGRIDYYLKDNEEEQLIMAAQLHDIGKLIVPREVLNKSTRLGLAYDNLVQRLEKIMLYYKIDRLEGRITEEECAASTEIIRNFLEKLPEINIVSYLQDEMLEEIQAFAELKYTDEKGEVIPYLNERELESLSIRKGTLTDEEREIVNQHVSYTDLLLKKIDFSEKYCDVRSIAANHHEYLNGTGYPKGLMAEDLSISMRILTVCDIFDSLTADDRPYKRAIPLERAIGILENMVAEGKLDAEIVRVLKELSETKDLLHLPV